MLLSSLLALCCRPHVESLCSNPSRRPRGCTGRRALRSSATGRILLQDSAYLSGEGFSFRLRHRALCSFAPLLLCYLAPPGPPGRLARLLGLQGLSPGPLLSLGLPPGLRPARGFLFDWGGGHPPGQSGPPGPQGPLRVPLGGHRARPSQVAGGPSGSARAAARSGQAAGPVLLPAVRANLRLSVAEGDPRVQPGPPVQG